MSFWQRIMNFFKQFQVWVLLILALIVGLIFVFAVPPWMHYDEPGHFEYAWLIANRPGFPERGDFDQDMRRQISASALEVDIEGYSGMLTDPLIVDQPIDIWLPQVEDHYPTYYFLAGLPLRLVPHSDIVFQLYLVRLVSLGMFLVLVWVGYRTVLELFDTGHPLTWMVPLFLITLPSLVDIMTAANNDVAAALAFTLFVWAGVALIKRGYSLFRVLALLAAVVACVFTKSTALMAVPLTPLVLLLALFRGKKFEKLAWLAVVISMVIGGALIISWRESAPAFFYSVGEATNPSREISAQAQIGEAVIVENGRFFHLLTDDVRDQLAGQTATFGAWIWADAETSIRPPGIREESVALPALATSPAPSWDRVRFPGVRERRPLPPTTISFTDDTLELTTTPQYFAFSLDTPPLGGDMSWIYFEPSRDVNTQVYWDGIVLVAGDFSDAGVPTFDDERAQSGTWGGMRFTNLVRNGSAEAGWPVFSGWISDVVDLPNRLIPSISLVLSVFDYPASFPYYFNSVSRIFRTFWAVFGWANVALFGQKPYRIFFILTVIYLAGIMIGLIRKKLNLLPQVLAFLGIAVVLQIAVTFFRGLGSWFWLTYIPVGRYIFPAILPVCILLMSGADQLIQLAHKTSRINKKYLYGTFTLLLISIMVWSIFSMWMFYYHL